MLKSETTFIVGAGGSWDFDFPLGDGLRQQIIELLAVESPNTSVNFKDPEITAVLRAKAIEEVGTNPWLERFEAYRRAARVIRDGLPFARSIDTFLNGLRDEPDVEFLGKLAIAAVILRAERGSPLVPYTAQSANAEQIRTKRLAKLVGSWHAQLSQILFEGHTRETIDDVFDNASFVIFNYDRCVEEFLSTSLARRFAISPSRARAVVARARIIHPYGQVGGFMAEGEGYVPFGQPVSAQLAHIALGIRTFTEAMEESVGDAVKDCIARAETLVFLGFGWLPQNMELLQASGRSTSAKKVFATVLGMPKGEVEVVIGQIDSILRRGKHTPDYVGSPMPRAEFIGEDGDCQSLMRNCWLRLTTN